VQLDEPIKQLGEFKVPVRLHKEVTVELTVVVAKEEAKVVVAKDETKKEEAKEEPKKEEAKEE
jgi:large subunit ribosomal protein L9